MSQLRSKGFTIIELTLAMAFVSMLLIAITMTAIQMANIYTKGVTLKQVNQLGSSLSQDIQSSLNSSSPLVIASEGGDFIQMRAPDSTDIAGGRICTGQKSYLWNTGKYMNTPVNEYETGDDILRFVKVDDKSKSYCANREKKVVQSDATELIVDGERDIAIHSLLIKEVAQDTVLQQGLYYVTLQIGTNDPLSLGTTTTADGMISSVDASCKPPSDENSVKDYCAVNKFEFTARAGNKGGL